MPSPFMPSQSYVAQAMHEYLLEPDTTWDELAAEDKADYMKFAKIAIAAIQGWQALHRADGSDRYKFNANTEKEVTTWEIYDKITAQPIGNVHDPLLAQQIVDDLNKHDTKKTALGAAYGKAHEEKETAPE